MTAGTEDLVGAQSVTPLRARRRDESDSWDWRTPPALFARLHRTFQFTVDAAASAENALLPRFWSKAESALARTWTEERVFCNPPFGDQLVDFLAHAAVERHRAQLIVFLLPCRLETAWWRRFVAPVAHVDVLPGRVSFLRPDGGRPSGNVGFGIAVCSYFPEFKRAR